jgi:hypothetical protein
MQTQISLAYININSFNPNMANKISKLNDVWKSFTAGREGVTQNEVKNTPGKQRKRSQGKYGRVKFG